MTKCVLCFSAIITFTFFFLMNGFFCPFLKMIMGGSSGGFFQSSQFFHFFFFGRRMNFFFLFKYYVFFSLCCSNSLKAIFSLDSSSYLDNLEITLIKAPFSSLNRWLSFFRCSSCFSSSSISASFFSSACFSFFSVSVRPLEG